MPLPNEKKGENLRSFSIQFGINFCHIFTEKMKKMKMILFFVFLKKTIGNVYIFWRKHDDNDNLSENGEKKRKFSFEWKLSIESIFRVPNQEVSAANSFTHIAYFQKNKLSLWVTTKLKYSTFFLFFFIFFFSFLLHVLSLLFWCFHI